MRNKLRRKTLPDRRQGFTLIELLVVIAILVVMSAVSFPKLGNILPNTLMKTTGRRLAITTRYLANQAILKGVAFRLYLNPKNGDYWSTYISGGEERNFSERLFRRRRLPGGLYFDKIEQPAPFSFEKKIPYVEFLPSGEVEQTLIVLASDNQRRKLSLLVHTYGGESEIKILDESESLL